MKKRAVKQHVEILKHDTYIALIQNSLGTKLFQNMYAKVNGKKQDIVGGGDLSCALYVSSLLVLAGFMKKIHTTVVGTEKDLATLGWKKTKKPKYGDILVWEAWEKSGGHAHIGFYAGTDQAISNSAEKRVPIVHHMYFRLKNGKPARKITAIYAVPKK